MKGSLCASFFMPNENLSLNYTQKIIKLNDKNIIIRLYIVI
jgi:hypothetical protein